MCGQTQSAHTSTSYKCTHVFDFSLLPSILSFSFYLRRYEEAKELHKLALYSTFDGGSHGLLLPLTELALKLNQQAKRARCHHTPPLQRFSASHGHKVKAAPAPLAARASPEKADLCQNRARSRELLLEALEYVPLRDEVSLRSCWNTIVANLSLD